MAIVMVALLAFGGSYALFTAQNTKTESGQLKTGKVVLGVNKLGTLATTGKIVTNTVICDGVQVESDSNVDTYVAVLFDAKIENGDHDFDLEDAIGFEGLGTGWEAIEGNDGNTYYVKRVAGADTTQTLNLCGAITFIGSDNATTGLDGNVSYEKNYMDATITLSVQSWAVQAHGITEDADSNTDETAALKALGKAN